MRHGEIASRLGVLAQWFGARSARRAPTSTVVPGGQPEWAGERGQVGGGQCSRQPYPLPPGGWIVCQPTIGSAPP